MSDLSQYVSVDSRTPMERMRRAQLHKVADALGIKYSPGAPKTAMIKLLEANDVDVTQPIEGLQWQLLQPSPQAVQAAALMGEAPPQPMLVPVHQPHASERSGVNANAVLSTKVSQQAEERQKNKNEVFTDTRMSAIERDNEKLKLENEHLRAVIERRLGQLEDKPQEQPEPASNGQQAPDVEKKRSYWTLYHKARKRGLPVRRGMERAELENLLETDDGPDAA